MSRFLPLFLVGLAAAQLTSGTGPVAAQQPAAGRTPDFDALAEETTRRLAEYLRIRTVNPPGNETAGARWLQHVLRGEGIESEIFESSPGRGNLYARLRGNGKRRPIVLLSHIDVVPATASAWKVAPWSGKIHDGQVWGRGALDMKGMAIVELMTLIALERRGVPLSRDIILIANADEETGSTGAEWFAREKSELIRDAEFLINEGGSNQLGRDGKIEYYGVAVTEKLPYWLRLTVRGSPGHGSIPRPDNAAARLSRALGRIAGHQTSLQVTPPAAQFSGISRPGNRTRSAAGGWPTRRGLSASLRAAASLPPTCISTPCCETPSASPSCRAPTRPTSSRRRPAPSWTFASFRARRRRRFWPSCAASSPIPR